MKICENFEKMWENFQRILIMRKVSLIITKVGNYAKKYILTSMKKLSFILN